ncbi:restriction endonuclease subunit S [Bacillus atrophaeus]|uniref:restriction endonuclease subunit S n=1 Tax=Bacillus atrophaeus TaxID=1452 RepID=UPI003D2637F6
MSKKKKTIEELLEEVVVSEEGQPFEAPNNWVVVKTNTVVDVRDGTHDTPAYQEEGIPLITSKNLKNGKLDFTTAKFISEESYLEIAKRSNVEVNDILFAMIGTIGNPVLIEQISQEFSIKNVALFKPNIQKLDSKYFYYYLQSPTYMNHLKNNEKGSTQKFVPLNVLRNAPLYFPPFNEQKRIAEKVERLLAKIEETKMLIEEAKETFELRRAAIIKNILKEEFLDDKLPTGWRKIQLKDLFNIFGGGTPSKSKEEYWNGKIPWISAKDMKTTFISETMDYITEEGLKNSSAKLAKRGSVAMVVRSGILQRTLPAAFLLSECTVNQDLKVFDSGDELINKYFMWYVKGNEKSLLHNYSKSGTTVNSIEFEKFKTHEILLPPVDVLKRKIDKVESAIEKEESANEILNIADSIEVLKQSILSKAFRGELGTNDPSEESAIDLLKEVLREQVK